METTQVKGLTDGQIKAAVDWWARVIQRPKKDNGDNSRVGGMTAIMAFMTTQSISEKQVEDFKVALSKRLKTDDQASGGIHCDYGPDYLLMEAMEEAHIPSTQAPWKTNMIFTNGKVKVSYGYGAEFVEIYPDIKESE